MQNFIKTIINAVQAWTRRKIKDSTADWSQNDSAADNYVKNRTHWEETVEKELLAPVTVEIDISNQPYVDAQIMPFIENQTYVVTWNGEEYSCTAYATSDGGIAIGNEKLFAFGENGGNGNGEPFFYISYEGEFAALFPAESGTYTISITTSETVVHKLDPKYLPKLASTPDWNQNDPEGEGYILNRPFYEEVEYITYIEEQVVTFTANSTATNCSARIPNVDMPRDEVPYRITFDGVEYEGIMTDNGNDAWINITLGDGTSLDLYYSGNIFIFSASFAGEHSIKVEGKNINVHTIDNKFLGVPIYSGTGINSICTNFIDNIASSSHSHAEGYNTTASGPSSHAEGGSTTASGLSSHAEGDRTIASSSYSHAEGSRTTASGYCSHAEGSRTTASGNYSHAEGYGTVSRYNSQSSSGEYNIDPGYCSVKIEEVTSTKKIYSDLFYFSTDYSIDEETCSYVLNEPVIAVPREELNGNKTNGLSSGTTYYFFGGTLSGSIMYELTKKGGIAPTIGSDFAYIYAENKYTITRNNNVRGEYVSIVGNGKSDKKRSNAHTLDWEGNAWYAGDVYVGSTSGTNKDEGSKKLATEEYVDTALENIQLPDVQGELITVEDIDKICGASIVAASEVTF